jgi:hypothetical protein
LPSGKERAKDQRAPMKIRVGARISELRNGLIAQGVMMATRGSLAGGPISQRNRL